MSIKKFSPLQLANFGVAISLRLILIENLKRISQRIMNSRKERDTADRLADALLNNTEPDQNFQRILERIGEPQVSDAFAVQFIQRLRDQSEMATEGLSWLKTKLEQSGR